jgi:hypothetical protein
VGIFKEMERGMEEGRRGDIGVPIPCCDQCWLVLSFQLSLG